PGNVQSIRRTTYTCNVKPSNNCHRYMIPFHSYSKNQAYMLTFHSYEVNQAHMFPSFCLCSKGDILVFSAFRSYEVNQAYVFPHLYSSRHKSYVHVSDLTSIQVI
ncbi:unnamed protein product, partial [Sphacelaria rigidula]